MVVSSVHNAWSILWSATKGSRGKYRFRCHTCQLTSFAEVVFGQLLQYCGHLQLSQASKTAFTLLPRVNLEHKMSTPT